MNAPLCGDDPDALRRELRRSAIARREALTATARSALTTRLEKPLRHLLATLAPSVVGFCWPFRGEPDLRRMMTEWMEEVPGRISALPVVLDKEKPLMFRSWTPTMTLVPDRHGILHPPSGEAVVPDVVLVPLNVFDAAGFRLGYGGGYFDRTLAVLDSVAVGVGFEIGRASTVFPQAHDRPMDWIVTEAGAFQARNMR
jgi:5-formyltetrahydrofolate cyclo-ligase